MLFFIYSEILHLWFLVANTNNSKKFLESFRTFQNAAKMKIVLS